jgi:cytidyltransferase-like protein
MNNMVVSGSFDDIQSRDIRFLEEASKLGPVHVLMWSDEAVRHLSGDTPRFTEDERKYFLEAVRFVSEVTVVNDWIAGDQDTLLGDIRPFIWVVMEGDDSPKKRYLLTANQTHYQIIPEKTLSQIPAGRPAMDGVVAATKKVMVTGCFDWLHSGHVRFFEETSELGDLYVVVGHDDNIRMLKGDGHPQFAAHERCYMVQSIRFVKKALISSGHGWMDAAPEIALLKPDIYAVNEDGHKPEKEAFCQEHGLEYVVLKRQPKDGLPQRTSTELRGF